MLASFLLELKCQFYMNLKDPGQVYNSALELARPVGTGEPLQGVEHHALIAPFSGLLHNSYDVTSLMVQG